MAEAAHGNPNGYGSDPELLKQLKQLSEDARVEPDGGALSKMWNLRTLADAYEPRPPLRYIIDGVFPLPSLNVVYGAPGSLKSMLLADAAVCIAGGLPWLPPLPNTQGAATPTIQVPVLWIDFDNGKRRTDERFEALARVRNLPADIPLHYVSMPTPRLDASSRANVDSLGELIAHLGAKFTVIDNLGLISGGVDENNTGMADVMGNLNQRGHLRKNIRF